MSIKQLPLEFFKYVAYFLGAVELGFTALIPGEDFIEILKLLTVAFIFFYSVNNDGG